MFQGLLIIWTHYLRIFFEKKSSNPCRRKIQTYCTPKWTEILEHPLLTRGVHKVLSLTMMHQWLAAALLGEYSMMNICRGIPFFDWKINLSANSYQHYPTSRFSRPLISLRQEKCLQDLDTLAISYQRKILYSHKITAAHHQCITVRLRTPRTPLVSYQLSISDNHNTGHNSEIVLTGGICIETVFKFC